MMKINTKKTVYASLLLAVGVLLPQVFHLLGGAVTGATFLPMHIPVLIAGLLLGAFYGSVIGVLAPVLSFLTTGMPTAERLPFMIVELAVYGLVSGFFASKTKQIYPVLIIAMVAGRVAYAGALVIAFYLFKMSSATPMMAWTALIKGLLGIVLQLVMIPPIIYTLRRYTLEGRNIKSKNAFK